MTKYSFTKSGYTLVEILVYIAVFVMISFVVVSLITSVLETNRQATLLNSLTHEAVSSLETITRTIRGADSVDVANSVFSSANGILQLLTISQDLSPKTVKFYLGSGVVKTDENGTYFGPLSSNSATVTALIFNLATSTKNNLVKIELDLQTGSGKYLKSEKFYSSTELRADNVI